MATDRLARQLLNMTSYSNVADPVKLAAIKDALDRGGIQAKTAVSIEVSNKRCPFDLSHHSSLHLDATRRAGGFWSRWVSPRRFRHFFTRFLGVRPVLVWQRFPLRCFASTARSPRPPERSRTISA